MPFDTNFFYFHLLYLSKLFNEQVWSSSYNIMPVSYSTLQWSTWKCCKISHTSSLFTYLFIYIYRHWNFKNVQASQVFYIKCPGAKMLSNGIMTNMQLAVSVGWQNITSAWHVKFLLNLPYLYHNNPYVTQIGAKSLLLISEFHTTALALQFHLYTHNWSSFSLWSFIYTKLPPDA
jgi:hypothetical protein